MLDTGAELAAHAKGCCSTEDMQGARNRVRNICPRSQCEVVFDELNITY